MISSSRARGLRAALAAAALGVATTAMGQSLPGLDGCLAQIEARRAAEAGDVGREDADDASPLRLGEVCPDLAATIDEGAWAQALGDAYAEDLTLGAFNDLVNAVSMYERAGVLRAPIGTDSLDDALGALDGELPEAQASLWQRVLDWIGEKLGSRERKLSWIDEWFENLSVPERVVRYALIALGVLLVAATVLVVINELRIAGVLAGGAFRKYSPLAAREAAGEGRVRDFDELARVPLARRPALVLLLVIDRLRARNREPLRDSLTHRELVTAADGLSAEQGDALRVIAGAAERATFGGWRPDEGDVAELVRRGRGLVGSFAPEHGAGR